jgi:multiple sugar transport system permease protein
MREHGPFPGRKRGSRQKAVMTAALTYATLMAVTLLFMAPFIWMVSTSLKADTQILQSKVEWVPRPAVWKNYPDALASFPFLLYLGNTLFVCVLVTIGTLLSSLLPAYGFSRLRWKGRDSLFVILLATIMLPAQVTMLPVFLIFRALGWTGTFLPLIVPAFFGSAFSIFLLRQFFLTVPQELSDAARIDGCSELTTLFRVVAPLAKPAMATVALFAFTNAWMDFMTPLIYLHDENRYTLAIGLQSFLGRHNSEWSLLMAAATVITLPMVVLFFFAQRTFIRGIALTGIK